MNLSNLPKDIIEKITNELSPSDLINFCSSKIDGKVEAMFNSNDFWLRRIKKDGFDKMLSNMRNMKENAEKRYLDLLSKILERVEEITDNIMNLYGDFKKFLIVNYRETIYKVCYEYTIQCLNYCITSSQDSNINSIDDLNDYITNFTYDYIEEKFRPLFPTQIYNEVFSNLYNDVITNYKFNTMMFSYLYFEI